ncbi:MAG: aa3-type cytochrome oxidase subunit II [Propionibacteriaceae bacterium]
MGREDVRPRWRRAAALAVSLTAGLLTGCSAEGPGSWSRAGLPEPSSDRALFTGDLWVGFWILGGLVAFLVWGLIIYAVIRFRRRGNEIPRQTRYNLPMEIFYTAIPLLIVGVLFFFTLDTQNKVMAEHTEEPVTIDVVGQKWSWTFNYKDSGFTDGGVYDVGTIHETPDLYLPVDTPVRFNLSSPDVIHSFWVPSFYMKLDVVPGRANSFDVTPTEEGTFAGKCAELCGTYHSAMIFNVQIVSQDEYQAHLQSLADAGNTGEAKGPSMSNDPAGQKEEGE